MEITMSILFVILCVVCFGWMFYMMTFRTDDWLRLLKEEEERKAKRQERAGKVLKGAFTLASWLSKK
jgi:Tfp pilus assembly protein PilO